jgi:hypothetical protein
MTNNITVGRRLIPIEHIAFVEVFDRAAQERLQTERNFKARLVLINRESVLSEHTFASIAEMLGFRLLGEDDVATNPAIRFRVETFEPAADFTPAKPYRTRLMWRDLDGNLQSKLLLTAPELVLVIVVKGEAPGKEGEASPEGRSVRTASVRRRRAPGRSGLSVVPS